MIRICELIRHTSLRKFDSIRSTHREGGGGGGGA